MGFLHSLRPCFFGLAFVHMWIYCSTHRPSITDDVSVMAVMYAVLSVALAALFFAGRALAAPGRPETFPSARLANVLDAASALAMAAGGVLLSVPLSLPQVPTVVAASALGGAGVGWAYARWCQVYADLDIHLSAPLAFATMALGSAGKTLVDFLPAAPAAAVLGLLPFATFACMRRSLTNLPSSPAPDIYYTGRTLGSLGRIAVGIAAFSLSTGLIQSLLLEEVPALSNLTVVVHHGSEILLAAAMLLWVTALGRRLDFSRTWRLILLLMATALIFEPYLSTAQEGYLLSLVRTAQTFLIVFLFLALADVARHSPYGPFEVFAVGWTSYALPFAIGKAMGDSLAPTGTGPLLIAVIVWALVVVTLFVLDDAAKGNQLIFTELNDEGDGDTSGKRMAALQRSLAEERALTNPQADLLVARCTTLAQTGRLTPREGEILELLARGRSKAHIADAFLISENTVRGHVKHIYAKLGVHNKQELVDALEAVRL